jgi:transcriptional regulator with GAF, ATPase, and Fis domain
VQQRRFRKDLYYRLAVFPIDLPPLSARRDDIAVVAKGFLKDLARRSGLGPWQLSPRAVRWLQQQPWRGNVRELTNYLERATIITDGSVLELGDEPQPRAASSGVIPAAAQPDATLPTLEQMERRHIEHALRLTQGKLYGPGGCADLLGVNPNTLRSRMKKLGLGGARDFRSDRASE